MAPTSCPTGHASEPCSSRWCSPRVLRCGASRDPPVRTRLPPPAQSRRWARLRLGPPYRPAAWFAPGSRRPRPGYPRSVRRRERSTRDRVRAPRTAAPASPRSWEAESYRGSRASSPKWRWRDRSRCRTHRSLWSRRSSALFRGDCGPRDHVGRKVRSGRALRERSHPVPSSARWAGLPTSESRRRPQYRWHHRRPSPSSRAGLGWTRRTWLPGPRSAQAAPHPPELPVSGRRRC